MRFSALFLLALVGCSTASGQPEVVPDPIRAIMSRPRYAQASWSLLVNDLDSGQTYYSLNADRRSLTGSTRKLFSVGLALKTLGSQHRRTTQVFRQPNGDLVLVADGDLCFGGRRLDPDTIQFTDFDHNDANGLGTAILNPQDPLEGLNQLAAQVRAAGVTQVTGEVVVDDRLFEPYRVPNGNLLVSPMMVNENQVDVTLTPTAPGQNVTLEFRPQTSAFQVNSSVVSASPESVQFSDNRLVLPGVTVGQVSGNLPADYRAPLTNLPAYVGTFRVEDPAAFARTAFIDALRRQGVSVSAPSLGPNPVAHLPSSAYFDGNRVAQFVSTPFRQDAKLVLKVSLNLGANLSLSLLGLQEGERTREGALAAERRLLIRDVGLREEQFLFPTNGSGTPDSEASPRALVQLLTHMARTPVAADFQASLPILGVDGSLATSGLNLSGRGHVFAKPGTTISADADGKLQLKAQNLAGYIETRSGRKLAYALMVNNAGPVEDLARDVGQVFEDEATISSLIYESF